VTYQELELESCCVPVSLLEFVQSLVQHVHALVQAGAIGFVSVLLRTELSVQVVCVKLGIF